MDFNREINQVFGQGSNLSKQHLLHPHRLHNDTAANATERLIMAAKNSPDGNLTANNTAFVNQIDINQTAANQTAVQRLPGNISVAAVDSIDKDFSDIIGDWNGSPEAPSDYLSTIPGPEVP
jgi:hypothetical protein